ncbi:hypothetical protein ACNFH8_17145, partial [Pseudomonas sp. NY15436]|uniref:hypothetical protein n=1 Tax=Pseudomonas sp. NY15436 TaxID=3400359 RepID=UPI003A8988B2
MTFNIGHVETQGKFDAIVDDATASPVPNTGLKIYGETHRGALGCPVEHLSSIAADWARAASAPDLFPRAKAKPPASEADQGSWDRSLTMTYSHMEKLHTTIGD